MTAIIVQPDTVWVKRPVDIRFTVDHDISPSALALAVYEQVKKGIVQWTRVNKRDEFLDGEPLKIRLSPFQGNADKLHRAFDEGKTFNYKDRLNLEGLKDYAVRIWFKSPADWVTRTEDIERPGEAEGFKNKEDLTGSVRTLVEAYEASALAAEKERDCLTS